MRSHYMAKCRYCNREAEYAGMPYCSMEGDNEAYVCGDHTGCIYNPKDIIMYEVARGKNHRW